MARNKFISSMIIFLALIIFCRQFHSTKARYLKHNQAKNNSNNNKHLGNDVHGDISATGVAPPPGRGVEDFRPMTPRHSPGVGHSVHN
ncbi:hypothetical protein GLYMA_17G176900v4 [Glycine max]|uniref:Uncharacterized protein n=2 Tax=Glycine subgen. Soja TaxID=1462606 RepID=A0A0R0FEB6_SOYBN|nr:hypothetical protein JHK86_047770 [Glycine max]KHN24294.1 hypothetical protein glysoja_045186 [Glycine soja]KAG4943743.1 hypothetical protein JHK85_048389 [Glycine max]KAG5102822.1 hypothetical protein JHK84_047791 [Glycine max]KAH1118922.1 hypothetical protein GYH30_047632 [Glycine max]